MQITVNYPNMPRGAEVLIPDYSVMVLNGETVEAEGEGEDLVFGDLDAELPYTLEAPVEEDEEPPTDGGEPPTNGDPEKEEPV